MESAVLTCLHTHGVALLPRLAGLADLDAMRSEAAAMLEVSEATDVAAGMPDGCCPLTRRWVHRDVSAAVGTHGALHDGPHACAEEIQCVRNRPDAVPLLLLPVPVQWLCATGAAKSAADGF